MFPNAATSKPSQTQPQIPLEGVTVIPTVNSTAKANGDAPQQATPVEQSVASKDQVDPIVALESAPEVRIIGTFFEILNGLLTQAKTNHKEQEVVAELLGNLMPENQEQFMACVNHIRGSEENVKTLTEDNCINLFWQHVLKKTEQTEYEKMLGYIGSLNDEFFHKVKTPSALLEKLEQGLSAAGLTETWKAFQPALKLYYIKFICFMMHAE